MKKRIEFYTDQELDGESGLYNYDARLYDPVIGRFVSVDPVIKDIYDPQYLNPYSYVRNNPLIYTDPSGKCVIPFPWWIFFPPPAGGPVQPAPPVPEPVKKAIDLITNPAEREIVVLGIIINSISGEKSKDSNDTSTNSKKGNDNSSNGLENGVNIGGGSPPAPGMGSDNDPEKGKQDNGISFGKNENQVHHTFRHIDEAGLNRGEVSQAIRQDLGTTNKLPQGLNRGTIQVQDKVLEYRAFKFNDGTVNVGRITILR